MHSNEHTHTYSLAAEHNFSLLVQFIRGGTLTHSLSELLHATRETSVCSVFFSSFSSHILLSHEFEFYCFWLLAAGRRNRCRRRHRQRSRCVPILFPSFFSLWPRTMDYTEHGHFHCASRCRNALRSIESNTDSVSSWIHKLYSVAFNKRQTTASILIYDQIVYK